MDTNSIDLYVPEDISEIVTIVKEGLESNFEEVEVCIEDNPPDFSQAPYGLSFSAIGGSPRLLDVGGAHNICYPQLQDSKFEVKDLAAAGEIPTGILFGAGAASRSIVGKNAELIPNYNLQNNSNATFVTKLDQNEEQYSTTHYDSTLIGPLANLVLSKGEQTQVLKINCKKRTGEDDFIGSIRKALTTEYENKNKIVGLGGIFRVVKGKIKAHVMPDFLPDKIMQEEELFDWLKFYEMEAPLVCQSTLISSATEHEFRLEHTHFFSNHNDGGHYHYDITPDQVEYEAFFVVCKKAYRISPSSPPQ